MCFKIKNNAKPWAQRKVYKRLQLRTNGYLYSPIYDTTPWQPGIRRCSNGPGYYEERAEHGIYVYKTYNDACVDRWEWGSQVVVELSVDPKDFLHTDGKSQATYKKVYMPLKQPEITFYDA